MAASPYAAMRSRFVTRTTPRWYLMFSTRASSLARATGLVTVAYSFPLLTTSVEEQAPRRATPKKAVTNHAVLRIDMENPPGEHAPLGALYLALAFVTVFFNTALVYAANERLSGGDPTLRSAIAGAARHIPQIFVWALISATVSVILRSLQERSGLLGRIVIGLVGMAWTLVTFLVIPVFVVEDIGVVDSVKRSATLFKRTWGENVAARVGFGLLGFLGVIPFLLIGAGAVAAGGSIAAIGVIIAVLGVAAVIATIAALNGIFQTALYHYASSGATPGDFFNDDNFAHAFVPRNR